MKLMQRLISYLCTFVIISTCLLNVSVANAMENKHIQQKAEDSNSDNNKVNNILSYNEYKSNNKNKNNATHDEKIELQNITDSQDANFSDNYYDKKAVIIESGGYAKWNFEIKQSALYQLNMEYIAAQVGNGNIEIGIKINNEYPFKEFSIVGLKRTYSQQNDFKKDITGSHIRPESQEILLWRTTPLFDATAGFSTPYLIYLEKGNHSISVKGVRGKVAFSNISFTPQQQYDSYKQYLEKNKNSINENPEDSIFIQAEKMMYKSDLTIVPEVDRDSPTTNPQSAEALLLNMIGGNGWKNPGEYITWEFTVKKSGFYKIVPRYRQNILEGIFTSRKILIDGKVPFEEAQNLRFDFGDNWQVNAVGNQEDFLFYLEKGNHKLTMEVTMGDIANMISQVQSSLVTLNGLYRRIVMITGSSPDIYRDYNFPSQIPEVIEEFKNQSKLLQDVVDNIVKQAGEDSGYTAIIKKIIFQLDRMNENPRDIAKYLEQFKANIGSLGTWLLSATEQPLSLDCIWLIPEHNEIPKADANFFGKLGFMAKSFVASFVIDYGALGAEYDNQDGESIKVWVQTGRDQAEILRHLTDVDFVKNHNTGVDIELVAQGTLLQSVLAGIGPDIAMDNQSSEPINYALRNAVVDISQFKDYKDITKRFHESALVPYTYKEGIYALPQTFSFLMFFYRTDIYEELGLSVPKSWDDLIDSIPDLQRRNLTMGVPRDINGYALILYQNKGNFFTNDLKKSNLNSNTSLGSFIEFTELFTLYDLPVTYDFANRFRTGEMPCGIQDYTQYNQLSIFAPEIKGLWEMIPVPGKADENGNTENVSVGTGTATMILNQTKYPEKCWEYLKWWTKSDIQSRYGQQMESVIGTGAKYNTANVQALTEMTWTNDEYNNLLAQIKHVKSIPELPGSYYLPRTIQFAFDRVYNSSEEQNMAENPVEVLNEYIIDLNDELHRKQQEFENR